MTAARFHLGVDLCCGSSSRVTSCLIQCRHADADCHGCCMLTCTQQQEVIEALQAGGPEQAPPQQVKALIRTMTLEKLFGGDQVGTALHCWWLG